MPRSKQPKARGEQADKSLMAAADEGPKLRIDVVDGKIVETWVHPTKRK